MIDVPVHRPRPDRTLVTTPRPATVTPIPVREPAKARAALGRYRVMAWITGVMLLVLVVEMLLKYVLDAPGSVVRWIEWVPFAHGWIYVVYLVTVLDLWSKMRWGFGRLVAMVLAGVVPVLSFVVERRVHADAETQLPAV
jgi:integral membrane protein